MALIAAHHGQVLAEAESSHPLPPTLAQDEAGHALALLGLVWDGDALADAKALLPDAVRTRGRSLEACAGEFVAIFAEPDGTLHVVNDRFASRPCYWIASHRVVSSHLAHALALAGLRPVPDPLGWVQVGALGHTLGIRTTWQGVRRLRPGTHLTLRGEAATEHRYWTLAHAPEDLDLARHVRETAEAFVQGARRRARLMPALVPLSGGLDSRLVAAAIPRDGHTAFTLVDAAHQASTPQSRVAAQICAALGMPHHLGHAETPYSRTARDVVRLMGGLRPLQHAAVVTFYLEAMARVGVRFMLGGGPGDVLAGSPVTEARHANPGATEACVAAFCDHHAGRARRLRAIVRDDVLAGVPLRESLEESVAGLQGPTAGHRLTAWRQVERQTAFTFTSIVHAHPDVAETFCHLDYRYVDLMLRLPAAWLYQRNFYRVMIHEAFPALRAIPYANTGERLTGHLRPVRDERTTPSLPARLLRGLRARLLPPRPGLHAALFRQDRVLIDAMREALHATPALHELLDAAKCERYLADYAAGRHASEEPFGTLATLCLAPEALA